MPRVTGTIPARSTGRISCVSAASYIQDSVQYAARGRWRATLLPPWALDDAGKRGRWTQGRRRRILGGVSRCARHAGGAGGRPNGWRGGDRPLHRCRPIPPVCVAALALLGLGCEAGEPPAFYRSAAFGDDGSIEGRERLDEEEAGSQRHYRFRSRNGELLRIDHYRGAELALDPLLDVASVVVEQREGARLWTFLDPSGARTSDRHGVSSALFLSREDGRTTVSLFRAPNGEFARKRPVAAVLRTFDPKGRLLAEKRFDALLQPASKVASITCRYAPASLRHGDDRRSLGFRALPHDPLFDRPRRAAEAPVAQSTAASLCESSDGAGTHTERTLYDGEGRPVADEAGTVTVSTVHDKTGAPIAEQYYGSSGQPAERLGVASIRWRYDDRGNPVERRHLDAGGELAIDSTSGIAVTRWTYDENGKRAEERYLDPSGHPVEDTAHGVACIRWTRPSDSVLEESYYGATGERVLRKDHLVAIVRVEDREWVPEMWYDDRRYTRVIETRLLDRAGELLTSRLPIHQAIYSTRTGRIYREYLRNENGDLVVSY